MKNNLKSMFDKYTYLSFTIIPVILYSLFYVQSVIYGIGYSFTNWNGIDTAYELIGVKNYIMLFKNPNFWRSMKTTLLYAIMLVGGVIILSLILSLALNSMVHFNKIAKSIFFVPAIIGAVTIALIWDQLFYRVVPNIGELVGIDWLKQSLLSTQKTALPAVVFVNIWQAVALPTIIFLAVLQSIPEELIESAMLDGANTFKRFRYITFPYILPIFTVNLVLAIKQGFTSFDFAYALTGGGPVRSTEVISILIYNDAFQNMRFSVANAEACILFVIVAIFSIVQIKLTSKRGVD